MTDPLKRYLDSWAGFGQLFRIESFQVDVRHVLAIPGDEFARALDAVTECHDSFIGLRRLGELLRGVSKTDEREALLRFLTVFPRLAEAAFEDPKEFSERLGELVKENFGDLAERDRRRLVERLVSVSSIASSGIKLAQKAFRVATILGHELESFELVCDLRPVFDDERTEVKGLIPVTTLQLVIEADDVGSKQTIQARISERDLKSLCKKAERARSKLDAMKAFVRSSGVPLPESQLTEDDTGEGVDQ